MNTLISIVRRVLVLGALCIFASEASAVVCTSLSAGTWNTVARWSCGHVPVAADTVVIAHNITLNNSYTIAGLTVNVGMTLSDTRGRNLTVTGNITNNGTITSNRNGQIGSTGAAAVISGTGTYAGSIRLVTSGTAPSIAAGSTLFFTNTAQIRTGQTVRGTRVAGSVLTINGTLNATGQTGGTVTPFIRLHANNTIVGSSGVITTGTTGAIQWRATGTLTNNGNVTVGNVTRNAGTGTWVNAANSNLTISTAFTATLVTLNASATGNTVTFISPAVPVTPLGGIYFNLGGTGVTCPHGFTVSGTDPCAGTGSLTSGPTSCTVGGGAGTINWLNPTNAFTNDNVLYATAPLNRAQSTTYLNCTGFNFAAIPAGATITGITVLVDRKASRNTTIRDSFVYLIKGGVINTVFNGATATSYTTVDVEAPHGGVGNLWGTTWTQADVTAANFGVAFSAINYSAINRARIVSVDSIRVKVDYAATAGHMAVAAANLGSTCVPSNVTISAHTASHAVPTGNVAPIRVSTFDNRGDWTVVTGAGAVVNGAANDGQATYTFAAGEKSVTLGLTHTNAATTSVGVADDFTGISLLTTTPAAELANTITFAAGSFAVTDVNGVAIADMTQIAGQPSATYYLKASSAACGNAFNNVARNIEMAFECIDPTTCQSPVVAITNATTNATTVLPAGVNNGTIPATYATVPLNFNANSLAPFKLNYPNVGKISLYFRYTPSSLAGVSIPFVVKPAGFVLSNIVQTACVPVTPATTCTPLNNPAATTAAGTAFIKAGEAFSATVTALTTGGVTKATAGTAINCTTIPADCAPSYGTEVTPEGVKLVPALAVGLGLTNNPVVTGSFGNFTGGMATGTAFKWDEVGIITLTPSVGDANYLGLGDVVGTTSGNIGRFILGKFALQNVRLDDRADLCQGGFLVADNVTPCAPVFTYLGEQIDVNFTLVPMSLNGGVVRNYVDSAFAVSDFAKLDPSVFANLNLAAVDNTTLGGPYYLTPRISIAGMPAVTCASNPCFQTGNADVTVPFMLNRNISPDGALTTVKIGIAPVEVDGARVQGPGAVVGLCNNPNTMDCYDLDTNAVAGNDSALLGTTAFRFGRTRITNAFGSELLPLTLPVVIEYWDNGRFIASADDNLSSPVFALGNYQSNLNAGETTLTPPVFTNGAGQLRLSAPGANNTGRVEITVTSPLYLPATGGWASFGDFYKGRNEIIYQREAY